MDYSAIQAAVASLKAAADITKGILEIKSLSEVQGKVIEIQTALLDAQNSALAATEAQFQLQERVRELEAQLAAVNDWETQKQRYALVSPWNNSVQVYALKRSHSEGEKAHWLCANCFHNARRTILNPIKKDGWVHLVCPLCKAEASTGYRGIGEPQYAEDIESG